MNFCKHFKNFRPYAVCATLALTSSLALADGGGKGGGNGGGSNGVTNRLFDFNDAYYQANGVSPAAISGRRQPTLPLATTSTPPLSSENSTRILLTLPAYDASGAVVFWSPIAGGNNT